MANKDCIFCKIVSGEIKSRPVFETNTTVAVNDINPVSEIHIVIIPKRHIESVLAVEASDTKDIMDMFGVAQKLVAQKKLAAFRLAYNGGSNQHVPHLHMHLLSGNKIKWSKL